MIVKKSSNSSLEEYIGPDPRVEDKKPGILELRKEKSRDAARSRRGKENYEFYELAKLLPLPAAITSQLDKASIIRLTISYLKLRDFSCHGEPQWTQEGSQGLNKLSKGHQSRLDIIDPFESRQGTHILQSLDGFAFILANDGRFLYISETVSIYLGLSQVEMAGSSIFDYVHPQDHTELAEQLGMCMVPVGRTGSPTGSGSDDGSSPATPRPSSPSEKGYMMVQGPDKNANKSFSLRMKSTLTKRGVHVKTSGYRVVHVIGTLRSQSAFGLSRTGSQGTSTGNATNSSGSSDQPLLGMVGMAIALPPPTITELRLELDTFITRLSPDFKVIYCEPIISDLMDLTVEDFTDRLFYDLCHVADLTSLRRSHSDILNKGQALTDYYRIMNRHGGYVWIQTCATTLLNNKNSDDQNILAINYVVSGTENKNSPLDLWQVTGDVNSSMSSSSNSHCREEKLKEIKASKPVQFMSSNNTLTPDLSSSSKAGVESPNGTRRVDKNETYKNNEKNSSAEKSQKVLLNNSTEENDEASLDKGLAGLDNKNKRRKMENPRKRKKSCSDTLENDLHEKALNLTRSASSSSSLTETSNPLAQPRGQGAESILNDPKESVTSSSMSSLLPESVTSSSPEDLSMKKSTHKQSSRNIIQHSSNLFRNTSSPKSTMNKTLAYDKQNHSSSPLTMTGSSVQELEAAMNRHLPASASGYSSQNEVNCFSNGLVASTGISKAFGTIPTPGISTHPPTSPSSWLASPRSSGPDMLMASNFLRTLYANRESVIKTSTRPQAPFLNPEPPSSLLTPPEPDPTTFKDQTVPYSYGKPDTLSHSHIYDKDSSYEARDNVYTEQTPKDRFSFIPYKDHIPSTYIDHISATAYKDHLTSTYKDLSAYKDIIPTFTIPSLMSPTNRMHQTYPSLPHHLSIPITTATMDACSITPPSSNSPDASKQASTQHYEPTSYSTDMTNTCNPAQKQVMNSTVPASSPPTSNHPYHPGRLHKDQLYHGVHGGDYTKGPYYSMSAPSAGSVYMDFNQNPPGSGQYEACARPVLQWY